MIQTINITHQNGGFVVDPVYVSTHSGVTGDRTSLSLDQPTLHFLALQIMRQELDTIDLDKEKLTKMLSSGNSEDFKIAIELLRQSTLYTWRILTAVGSISVLYDIIREFTDNNRYNLQKKLM